MQRKINFNAGPAQLPPEVLQQASLAVQDYNNTGSSILEIAHRGKEFLAINEESRSLVMQLCGVNDDYEVLWLQGGARMQFCMVPMNFLHRGKAGFIDSGFWAADAAKYAAYYGDAQVLASSKSTNYDRLPDWPQVPSGLNYLHICTNNTIFGTQWHDIPKTEVPLIADMSSDIFSTQRDYSQYGMFYATVQKNLGTSGVALAVIRKDMLEKIPSGIPPMLCYRDHVKEQSILNTQNVFGVYVALLMLRWTAQNGIGAIAAENNKKAELLYRTLDESSLFTPHVMVAAHRSKMNVCFTAKDAATEQRLLDLCKENNIIGIKGHRYTGGFRVSLYNAVTYEQVETLVALMRSME